MQFLALARSAFAKAACDEKAAVTKKPTNRERFIFISRKKAATILLHNAHSVLWVDR
jgi:hypothetical protein